MSGADLAKAAASLIGTRWRLHGRDPATWLDCIGLLAAALAGIGRQAILPTGYPLRLRTVATWLPDPTALGFAATDQPIEPGDVILNQPGPAQIHLAIAAPREGWIHANAGLRQVVQQSELPPGAVLGRWRLTSSQKGK